MPAATETLKGRISEVSELLAETAYGEYLVASQALSKLVTSANGQGRRIVLETGDNFLGVSKYFFTAPNAGGLITHTPDVLPQDSSFVFNRVIEGRGVDVSLGGRRDKWYRETWMSDGLYAAEAFKIGVVLCEGGTLSSVTRTKADQLTRKTARSVKRLI